MPNKFNAERRHHIPKMQFKVTNWAEYEAGLRRRGSLTLWVTEAAIDAWNAVPRATPGGQATYSDSAIQAQGKDSCVKENSAPDRVGFTQQAHQKPSRFALRA
jgi:hypothetical protein